jgi:hypothetical protein
MTKKENRPKFKVAFQGQQVSAVEMDYKVTNDPWTEIKCADGTVIKMRINIVKIMRLEHYDPLTGEPAYLVQSTTLVQTRNVPDDVRHFTVPQKAPIGKEVA